MPAMVLRYHASDKGIAEIVDKVEATFAALKKQKPAGVRYAYGRLAGANEFVAVLDLDEGVANPLLGIDAARELQSTVAKWVDGSAPTPHPVELIGSYGFDQ